MTSHGICNDAEAWGKEAQNLIKEHHLEGKLLPSKNVEEIDLWIAHYCAMT